MQSRETICRSKRNFCRWRKICVVKNIKSLYDPTKTDALTLAQREFYELYIQYYEKELLLRSYQNK